MGTSTNVVRVNALLLQLACSAVVAIAIAAGALAAETKAGGGAVGPSQGTVGGGAIGANRGGAGGVSNPDLGGPGGSLGGPGESGGPRATTSSRPGYLGGRGVDDGGPDGDPTDAGDTHVALQQLGQCDVAANRMLTPEQRVAGRNGWRLQHGYKVVSTRAHDGGASSRQSMLASYQQELEKAAPDPMLAGVYLGIAANAPVTASMVSEVSAMLCVPVSMELAERIAPVAEAQRRKLSGEDEVAAGAVR